MGWLAWWKSTHPILSPLMFSFGAEFDYFGIALGVLGFDGRVEEMNGEGGGWFIAAFGAECGMATASP